MAVLDAAVKRRALAAATMLDKLGTVRASYLFGSHVEGRADRWSDIDVAVFMDGIETWDIRRRARAMAQVQREIGCDIEAHLFPASAHYAPEPGSFAEYIHRHGVRLETDDSPETLG
ncbi:MAG TPA: nucleotidyltransferase domain-containing protein [Candidatus Hydrogenedentes bacterium]|nr:nucleotidyltransferase domain-containing protein [Candidatus Hydrogenedentota bacterium]HPG66691.1 nucleotidyltransferase domain-containing protein [Candidatus Hydrogenedentota bacterium]